VDRKVIYHPVSKEGKNKRRRKKGRDRCREKEASAGANFQPQVFSELYQGVKRSLDEGIVDPTS